MNLFEQIQADLTTFLRAKDEIATSTLRLLLSNIHNAEIAKGSNLIDSEVLLQITKDAKRHRESIEAYASANRNDLAEKEQKELAILEKYLPEQLKEEELSKIVEEEIKTLGADQIKDMGKVMAQVMAKVKGRADGGVVSAIVKSKLENA